VYPHAADFGGLPAGISDRLQPVVYPNWDNTPRSGRRGLAITGSTPQTFARHVAQAAATMTERPAQEQLLWIKSWNEWAEGNYLEPDQEHGHGWLRALRSGLGAELAVAR
jgi:hypothetical protein